MATVNKVDLSLGEFWEPFFVGWLQALSLAQPGVRAKEHQEKCLSVYEPMVTGRGSLWVTSDS